MNILKLIYAWLVAHSPLVRRLTLERSQAEIERLKHQHAQEQDRLAGIHAEELRLAREDERGLARQAIAGELDRLRRDRETAQADIRSLKNSHAAELGRLADAHAKELQAARSEEQRLAQQAVETVQAEVERLKQYHAEQVKRLSENHVRDLQVARDEERVAARLEVGDELAHHKREHQRWLEHAASRGDYTASAIMGGVIR